MTKYWRRLSPQQFFLITLPFAFVFAVIVLFVSGRNFLLQRTCGCGPLVASPTGDFDSTEEMAIFENKQVSYPLAKLIPSPEAEAAQERAVLGATTGNRWIEIDLSEQRLYAHEGDTIVYNFLISSGKPWTPTVTGDFRVWIKLRYTKMSGGSRALGNYYYLPNVPYTQYYYRDYGLHGTYWHNNFGHQMSHGCVNLATPDAEKLFYWTGPVVPSEKNVVYASKDNPGTRVVVHD